MFKAVLGLGFAAALPLAAEAGTLEETGSRFCDWQFSGVIEEGDADLLGRIPGSYDGVTLCLNSPGGNLLEGQSMFEQIWDRNIRTAILPGHQCESACAVAFLGGSADIGTDVIKFPNRSIWPGGRLGFHGPSLSLSADSGPYSADAVGKAFTIALKAAENFYAINKTSSHGHRAMTDHTYQSILATHPSDMYHVSTIGDVILSKAHIAGVSWQAGDSAEAVRNICDNLFLSGAFPSREGVFTTYDGEFSSTASAFQALQKNREENFQVQVERSADGLIKGYAGPYRMSTKYYVPECFVTFQPGNLGAHDEEFPSESDVISAQIRGNYFGGQSDTFSFDAWRDNAEIELAGYSLQPWYALPFYLPLDDLPLRSAGKSAKKSTGQAESALKEGFLKFPVRDLAGGDLGHVSADSAKSCLGSCNARGGCDAVTYDRWNKVCFMKSVRASGKVLYLQGKSDSFISRSSTAGIEYAAGEPVLKKRGGKGFFDVPMASDYTGTFKACRSFCEWEQGCVAFNFQPGNGTCELFDAPGEYFDRAGYELGMFYQPL